MNEEPSRADRLDSWKAIARYLGRSVRTVRRWEADEGLPVHRHMHRSLASVYAFKSELDTWQGNARRLAAAAPERAVAAGDTVFEGLRPTLPGSPARQSRRAVVVLPFVLLGPESSEEYLADGFTEEVITRLSAVHALRVISQTSSMSLKGTTPGAPAIGRLLDVDHLLEGSVRLLGNRVRVSVRLVATETDEQRWAEVFDDTLDEVFAIQERIARSIVRALELRLTGEEDQRLARLPARGNLEAWQLALAARQQAMRWRPDAIDEAVRLLERGLELAPDDPWMHAALGRTWLQYREAGIDLSEVPFINAETHAARLLAMDPQDPGGHQLRGWIHYCRGDVQQAVVSLKHSARTNFADPDTLGLLANCYLISGRMEAAREVIAQVMSVDPLTPLTQCMPGWADVLDGEFERALPAYRRMFDMDPGNPIGRLFYVWALIYTGAAAEAARVAADYPPPLAQSLPAHVAGMLARAANGESTAADAELPTGFEAVAASSDMFPRLLAQAYALAGNTAQAVRWIDVAVDRGFIHHPFLAGKDPILARLLDEPAYQAVLERAHARWLAFEA
jgi:TolB-like protein